MAKLQNIPPAPDPHEVGLKPWHFIKASRSVTGDKATVKLPKSSNAIDWEAELGAVIGKTAKDVPLDKALDYVAGYTVANELSARDLGKRDQLPDSIAVQMGLGRPEMLRRRLPDRPGHHSGERHQGPAEARHQAVGQRRHQAGFQHQRHDLQPRRADRRNCRRASRCYPGDIILTGTPAGVGAARRGIPEGRRRDQGLGRERRHADQQDGVALHRLILRSGAQHRVSNDGRPRASRRDLRSLLSMRPIQNAGVALLRRLHHALR